MRRKPLVLLALSTIVTLMCVRPNLDSETFTRNKPEVADVVGTYIPTDATAQIIRSEGGYDRSDAQIILSADGTFEMVAMPDWWNTNFGEPMGGYDSGQGRWQIEKHQEWWAVQFGFDTRQNFHSVPSESGLMAEAMLAQPEPPYRL